MIDEHRRVIVDEHRHQLSIDEEQHGAAAGDHVQLVPVTDLPDRLECIRITNRGELRRFLTVGHSRANDLTAKRAVRPRRNAATRTGAAFDERAGIAVGVVDVRLVSARLPFRPRIPWNFAESHRAKLNAAVRSGAFQLDLAFELEILRLTARPQQIYRARRGI